MPLHISRESDPENAVHIDIVAAYLVRGNFPDPEIPADPHLFPHVSGEVVFRPDDTEIRPVSPHEQDPRTGSAVTAVIAASDNTEDPFCPDRPVCFFYDLQGTCKGGPLHEHTGRHPDFIDRIGITGFHLRGRDNMFHLLFLLTPPPD